MTLEERCNLDDKTFRALESILDTRACAKDEVDGAGNPIICRACMLHRCPSTMLRLVGCIM